MNITTKLTTKDAHLGGTILQAIKKADNPSRLFLELVESYYLKNDNLENFTQLSELVNKELASRYNIYSEHKKAKEEVAAIFNEISTY